MQTFPRLRRRSLWLILVSLIVGLLALLMWLSGRYEASAAQDRLEREALDAVTDVRSALLRNVQALQTLAARTPGPSPAWDRQATELLNTHREMLRIEWRDAALRPGVAVDSPLRLPVFDVAARYGRPGDLELTCAVASRTSGHAYGTSYFVPGQGGTGLEAMEMCLPLSRDGVANGFLIATYALNEVLSELVGPRLARGHEVSLTQADGTRLAFHGAGRRGNSSFKALQVLDLPGNTLVLRLDIWRSAPGLFANFLTALVASMSVALACVLGLLAADMRRRQRAEHRLAEALAFRKAMEDSLVTGLRARDLAGRTTYVNPAFCDMVGWDAPTLLDTPTAPPYWPPESAVRYQERQDRRLAGSIPPREGFESVFVHRDGRRFAVMVFEAPLIDASGQRTGWMSAIVDISAQRRVEELSRASQDRLQATARLAAVGEMASLLSHELNQPLAAISGYATGSMNLLQESWRAQDKPLFEEALRHIAGQATRAGTIVKSVHDFVRRRARAREAVAPRSLLDAIEPLLLLQARKLDVRLELQFAAGLPDIWCDRTMMEQVLLNLVRNAMQAMDFAHVQSRVVSIHAALERVADHRANVLLSVADRGEGITPDIAAKLFTPFFTTKAEGMGLGLSLCRTVLEQHGGALWFEPNQPCGTIFHCRLAAHHPVSVPSSG